MARSMAPLYDGHDYYKRMFELQEKLRKSEEERIRLEERFNVLMRQSHNRHDVCINRLRMRYIEYLEEQRTRDERNHKLLAALDRVMNKLALISAKKDRLNVLRKQYETYLLRAYANHRPPGSVTGDSGIASQNEDRYTKRTVVTAHPDLASAETRGVSSPLMHPGSPDPQSSRPRSTSASRFHDQIAVDASLNNLPVLTAAPLGATLDVDHRQTNVLRGPHVNATVPDAHQYLRVPSNYDEGALRSLQHVPNIRISYAEAPVPSAPPDNMQTPILPANRFFREHVESVQAASGLPATARFPAEETSRNVPVPRQFDPLVLLQQYHDANILLSDPRRREYNPADAAAMGPTLVTGKSSAYRAGSDVNVANQIGPLPGYMDYVLASMQRSDDEGSTRSITSDDLDGLIRRNERLLWSKADVAQTPSRSPLASGIHNANLDENGMTAIVENELDRYISNIRRLHREHGVQSLDNELDHEQNTSGDLLNVSLSEDALDLPAEDRVRKERVPEEMGKILALASDLASGTANLKEVAPRDSAGGDSPAEIGDGIRQHEIAKSDALEFKGKREAEGRARSEIREDVATHSAELEQSRGDTRIAKENWNIDDSTVLRDRESTAKKNKADEEIAKSDELRIDDLRSESKKKFDLVTSKESNIEDLFDTVEELAPWDLASVQKQVRELRLDDSDRDRTAGKDIGDSTDKIKEEIASELPRDVNSKTRVENAHPSQDTLPRSEPETKNFDVSEVSEVEEQSKTHGSIKDAENVDAPNSKVSSQQSADEAKIVSQSTGGLGEQDGSDRKQTDDGTTELRVDDQFEGVKDGEYSVEQGYVEDPSQSQQYEQQDPNQQYYDPNIPYEAGNEEYASYPEQGYAQEGQEYVEYVDGQYEQYPEDLSNQQYQHYPDAQYEQDPNQAYDYGYDPNQGYGDPSQQYDPNQGYENSPDNQAYDYTEQVPYDPNQTYDNAYEQEYKEEQRKPDDNVEDRAEKPEAEEASQEQADPASEHKSDGDKSQHADAVNGTKKKKDVIKSLLDSDTDTTIERNVSNTESDFDFN